MTSNIVNDNIFTIGELIEIEIEELSGDKSVFKVHVYVEHSNVKFSIAAPMSKGYLYPVPVGRRLNVYFYRRDSGVFSFQAMVVSRTPEDNLPAIQLLRIGEVFKSQRRMYFRMPYFGDIIINLGTEKVELTQVEKIKIQNLKQKMGESKDILYDSEDYREIEIIEKAEGRDLSGGGFRCITKKKFSVNEAISGYIVLNSEKITFNAIIKRSQENILPYKHYEIGAMFENIDENTRTKIINYIFDKQRKTLNNI